jgi:hypothetical protein
MKRPPLSRSLPVLTAVLLLTAAAPPRKPADVVWIHPDKTRLNVGSIAILPVVALDGDARAVTIVEKALPWKWVPTGHGWLQASSSQEKLRAARDGEALLQKLTEQVRHSGRMDSVIAQRLARLVPLGAYLVVRVDAWRQYERDRTQLKAKPSSTTIGLTAALVDSNGTLLWSISGSEVIGEERGESQAGRRPSFEGGLGGPMGIRPGALGIGLQTVSTAPTYEDVLARLLARWKPLFPTATRRPT